MSELSADDTAGQSTSTGDELSATTRKDGNSARNKPRSNANSKSIHTGVTKPKGITPEVFAYPNFPTPRTIRDTVRILGYELPNDATVQHAPSYYLGNKAFKDSYASIVELLGDNWPPARRLAKLDPDQRASEEPALDAKFQKNYRAFKKQYLSQDLGEYSYNPTNMVVLFCDWVLFARVVGWNVYDYFYFNCYAKEPRERKLYLNSGWINSMVASCGGSRNRNVAHVLTNKEEFLEAFAPFIKRDWIYPKKATFGQFCDFAERHSAFFVKPLTGLKGKGAYIVRDAAVSPEHPRELYERLCAENCICEELIIQHPGMAAFCPDTVNTIRTVTILDPEGKSHLVGTALRTGRLGGCVDNCHIGGGFSAVVDEKTGIVKSHGITMDHRLIAAHLDTGTVFKGHVIPQWDDLVATVNRAAESMPDIKFIGWDVAISADRGIVIIEGNARPAIELMQKADQRGKRSKYRKVTRLWEEINGNKWHRRGKKLKNYVCRPLQPLPESSGYKAQ